MIHYHGLPITPNKVALTAIDGGHAFISFLYPQQFSLALGVCQSFAVDNGAFSSWKQGNPVKDWGRYYEWVAGIHNYPSFDFAVIPDVIDGSENDNDVLVEQWAWKQSAVGAPVWHMHESLKRLERLACEWPRVCLGSSGEYSVVGNKKWWFRMNEAMNTVCNKEGLPICKLHGLRMLNPSVFMNLPLASADSTNIARNVGIDSAWKGTYTPPSKEVRAWILRQRIEKEQSQTYWQKQPIQECLLENSLWQNEN
jgi:hypothetical protein